jgi:xylan 1,4-beta-xylosidase
MVGRVRRALTSLAFAAALALPAGAAAQTAEPLAAQAQPPLASPVVAGDWPDPDVSLIDGSYYAVATGGGWSPTFTILRSTDLRTWSIGGSVFRRPPGWAKDSFWAPELAQLPSGGYAFFYSAMPKRPWQTRADGTTVPYRGAKPRRGARTVPDPARPWYCLGVATAPSPLGPWRDLGKPLRCTPTGTIDPTPVVDGDKLYLVYKEDGNAFRRPTPIVMQELRADGRRLLGEPRELLRNQPASWEREVIEAPFFVRRPDGWTMFYSGALCCSPKCSYAVGAARAPTLAGPWTRYSGNPILRSGNGWRCPGHVSVVGDHVAFHAYRAGSGFLAGRQMHVAPLTWRADGWPAIGDGRPLPPAAGALTAAFDDRFASRRLAPEWEWPAVHPPRVRAGVGRARPDGGRALELRAPTRSAAMTPKLLASRIDAGLLARRLGSARFTATAVVDRSSLAGRERAGVAVVRSGPFALGGQAIGVAVGALRAGRPAAGSAPAGTAQARRTVALTVWARGGPRPVERVTELPLAGTLVHLRLTAVGRRVRVAVSPDGTRWKPLGGALRSPVEETARIALTAGGQRGAGARFTRATLVER